MNRSKTKNMILAALFAGLIAIGAFIKIPIPVVPFTLQFLFTMLAGLLLGANWGFLSVGLYLVIGLIGFPVFAQGGGLSYIFQPSFGYLIGFALGAYATGRIVENKLPSYGRLLMANLTGLAIVYLVGLVYYYFISALYLNAPIGLWPLFLYGFVLAVPGDLALCLVGAALGVRLIPWIKRGGY